MDHHRAGKFKQRNKAHKAGKKANYAARKLSTSSNISFSQRSSSDSRIVRLNKIKQLRSLKRQELQNSKRNLTIAPILVAVFNFGKKGNLFDLVRSFYPDVEFTSNNSNGLESIQFYLPVYRCKYHLILLNPNDLNGSLDLARISDVLLVNFNIENFLSDGQNFEEYYSSHINLFDAIYNHCLPSTVYGLTGSINLCNSKTIDRARKLIRELVERFWFGSLNRSNFKLRALESSSDLSQLFHYLSGIKRKPNSYCSRRSQLLAQRFVFEPYNDSNDVGDLLVEGYVRSNPFNVNSLVYIPGFGEFQLNQIETVEEPNLNAKPLGFYYVLKADKEIRPSLERENPIRTILDEDMEPKSSEILIEKRKVPKGTSDYQAAWIVDSDDEGNENDCQSEEEATMEKEEEEEEERCGKSVRFAALPDNNDLLEADDDDESVLEKEVDSEGIAEGMDYDNQVDMEEDQQMLAQFKEQRIYEMFPDEIDTPTDRLARDRFAKYRGLKSFRTSIWDSKENLPPDYSRIFQFENFNRTRRRLFKTEPSGADVGHYVRLQIINVPRVVYNSFNGKQRPLVVYELLAHEHKMSVLNIVLKKVSTFDQPIQSKEKLIFQMGCRRFVAAPTFSAHTVGDKHKYERFLRSDVACVATLYGPITFPPASVLVFKQLANGSEKLVATGFLMDCSPDRLVIKRYLLSGHPFKINRKHAVIRYMFFNREDILWFRPIELRTKYGRKGNIIEPLGTHGHMKCTFNHQLVSQDTVLMPIYKRIFPKWYYRTLPENETICQSDPIQDDIMS